MEELVPEVESECKRKLLNNEEAEVEVESAVLGLEDLDLENE